MKGSSFSCWQEARNIEDVQDEIDDDEDNLTEEECRSFAAGKRAGRAEERARVRAAVEALLPEGYGTYECGFSDAIDRALAIIDEVKP